MPACSMLAIVLCLAFAAAWSFAAAIASESVAASVCAVSIESTGARKIACGCGMSLREVQKSLLYDVSCTPGGSENVSRRVDERMTIHARLNDEVAVPDFSPQSVSARRAD